MKYAITCVNEEVFQHFGKCPSFLLLEMEDGIIAKRSELDANGSGHGALVTLLADAGVETLICGGIGQGARNALSEAGISLISGAKGNVEVIINALIDGTLKDDPNGQCNHHHEGGHHDCGSHGCK